MLPIESLRTPLDMRLRILNVPVRISPFFWLISLSFAFQWSAQAAGTLSRLQLLALSAFCMAVAVLFHEFGHALTARWFGVRTQEVILQLLGGVAVCEGQAPRLGGRLAVLINGPAAGLLLAGALYGLLRLLLWLRQPAPDEAAVLALAILCSVSFYWAVFNLLPILPLDGGQIMRELFVRHNPIRGERRAVFLSLALAVAGLVLALLDSWSRSGSWFMPLLFLVMVMENLDLRRQLAAGTFSDERPRAPWERDPEWWRRK
jgi:Zn-dependent protease